LKPIARVMRSYTRGATRFCGSRIAKWLTTRRRLFARFGVP
jgi:hypothetical protein